jgi:autotransporter-associated beta strand protein
MKHSLPTVAPAASTHRSIAGKIETTSIRAIKRTKAVANFCFAIFALLFANIVIGQTTKTWTGASSTAWATAGNWSPSGAPGTSDNVIIGDFVPGNQPTISANTTIGSLTIRGRSGTFGARGGMLTISTGFTLTVTNNVSISGSTATGTEVQPGITASGTANVTIGGNLTTTNATAGTGNPTLILNTGTLTVGGDLILTSGAVFTPNTSTTVFNGTTGIQTFNSAGDNFNNITKTGAGTVALAANVPIVGNLTVSAGSFDLSTFTANRTAAGGTLTVAGTLLLGGTTGGRTGSNFPNNFNTNTLTGGTIVYNNPGNQTVYASVTYNNLTATAGGTKTLGGATTVNGALTVEEGTTLALSTNNLGTPTSLNLNTGGANASAITGTGTLTLGGNVSVTDAGTGTNGVTISCPVALGATRTFTVDDDNNSSTDLSITGLVSGAAGIIKAGAGSMNLGGANTFTGVVTVSAGILRASSTVASSTNGAFGNSANSNGANLILNGGTIQSNTATFSKSIRVDVSGSGIDAYGSARTISSTISRAATGTVTLNVGGDTEASGAGQDLTLSGTLNNTSGSLAVTKIGSSTVDMTGSHSYSGATTVSGGILRASNSVAASTNGAFGNSSSGTNNIVLNGGTIQFNNGTARTISANIVRATAGAVTLNLGANTVASAEGQNLTLSGTITNSSGTLNIEKVGSSIAIYTNTGNTYTGTTTITDGQLRLNPSGNVTTFASQIVLNGGTLSTTGITATRTFTSTSTVKLDANSTIALASNNHTLTFANSNAVTWAGSTLTVSGWAGTAGASGTNGKINFASAGLTSGQLAKFNFSGYDPGSAFVSNEVVPAVPPTPVINSSLTASTTYGTGATYNITADGYYVSSYNATGLPTGMSVNTSTGVITIAATTAAGVYPITISATNSGGTGTAELVYTVQQKGLTITGLSGVNKVYDGATTASLSGTAAYSGLVNGESFSVSGTPSANFADKNVGTGKVITVTGYTAPSANYTVTQPAGLTANITALAVTISGTRSYNGLESVAGAVLSVSNAISGDDISFTGSGKLSSKDVGTRSLTTGALARVQSATGSVNLNTSFTVNLGSAPVAGNSLIAVISTRGTAANQVTSIAQTGVTWTRASQATNTNGSTTEIWYASGVSTSDQSIVVNLANSLRAAGVIIEYSGVLSASPLDVVASNTGNGTTASTGTTATTAQANELWIGGIGLVSSSYTLGTPTNSYTAVANAASGSGTATNNARVYALERFVTATGTQGSGGTVSTSSQWSGTVAKFKAAVASGSTLALSGADAANYTLTGFTGSVVITEAPLTITGISASNKVYDGNATASLTGTAAYNGLQNGESFSVSGSPSASFDNKNVGTGKTVTVTGYTAPNSNYSLTQPSLTANITVRNITVTASADFKEYDGNASSSATPSVPALQSGDVVGTAPTQSFNNKNVGTGKTLTASGLVINDGNGGNNYNISYANNNTGIIIARPLVVTATGNNKVYDGNTTATVTLNDNRVSGDDITTAYTSANFVSAAAGNGITINVSGISITGGADQGNYELDNTTATASADILPVGQATADFRSSANGDLSNPATWEYNGGGDSWFAASQKPGTGNNVQIRHNVTFDEAFTVGAGKHITVSASGVANFNGQSVTFKSDGTGTASLGKVDGSVTGATNVTVERYLTANGTKPAWRQLSVPTTGTQTIRQAWMEGDANTNPMDNNNPGFGTLITSGYQSQVGGAAQNPGGFDIRTQTTSIRNYNGTAFVSLTSVNRPVQDSMGFFLFVRGDRSVGLATQDPQTLEITTPPATSTILRSRGGIVTGDVKRYVKPGQMYKLIANPYPSEVDFANITRVGGIANYLYLWDASLGANGGYETFSGIDGFEATVGGGSWQVGQSNSKIQSGQAFMVSATGGGYLLFTENSKTNSSSNKSLRPVVKTPVAKIVTKLYVGDKVYDANTSIFDKKYSVELDVNDAIKITNPGENFAIERNGQALAVEARPAINGEAEIRYNMGNMKQQAYTLEVKAANITGAAYLVDKYLGTSTPVDLGSGSKVEFTITADAASAAADRFKLVLRPTATEVPDTRVASIKVFPNPVEDAIVTLQFVKQPKGRYTLTLTDLAGRVLYNGVKEHAGGTASQQLQLPAGIARGAYNLSIIAPDKTTRQVQQVFVNTGNK